jgi:hypothetical protein
MNDLRRAVEDLGRLAGEASAASVPMTRAELRARALALGLAVYGTKGEMVGQVKDAADRLAVTLYTVSVVMR